jgi:hypothetical protein
MSSLWQPGWKLMAEILHHETRQGITCREHDVIPQRLRWCPRQLETTAADSLTGQSGKLLGELNTWSLSKGLKTVETIEGRRESCNVISVCQKSQEQKIINVSLISVQSAKNTAGESFDYKAHNPCSLLHSALLST